MVTSLSCEISGSYSDECEEIAFWEILPCSLVEADRRFGGACCLHHIPDARGSTQL
jgi:hypothetical protein